MRTFAVALGLLWLVIAIWLSGTLAGYSDCTGCAPGRGYEHHFHLDGTPRVPPQELTIDPRGVVWFKGKRAEDMTDEELREVVMLLLEIVRK